MTRDLRRIAPDGDVYNALRDALAGGPTLLVAAPRDGFRPMRETVEQRIAVVVETSGSTGRPKEVTLSSDALLASAAASESALGGPGQWVLALPTYYIAGLNVLVRSIAAGTDPVTVEGDHFTAAGFIAAARRMSVPERFTALVPAQLSTLLDDPESTSILKDFRGVLIGGQAVPAVLRKRAEAAGIRVIRSYGSTETSGGCVYDGAPIGQTIIRIEGGEVWLHGPTLAEGYRNARELTDIRFPVVDGLRWFATGDEGRWDGEKLTVTGRRDDVLISGGVKVSAAEVEAVLRNVGFDDAVVVAVPDQRWGQVPVAFTTGEGELADARAAVEFQLGRAARPARLVRLQHIPLLPSGKPDRLELARSASATQEKLDPPASIR